MNPNQKHARVVALLVGAGLIVSFLLVGQWIAGRARPSLTSEPTGRLDDTWHVQATGQDVIAAEKQLAVLFADAEALRKEPETTRTAVPDARAESEQDPVPLQTPTDFDLREQFLHGPAYVLKADDLAYHVELNPDRRTLTWQDREELALLVKRWSRIVGSAYLQAALARDAEFMELIDAGVMRPLDYTTDPKVVQMMKDTRARYRASGQVGEPIFTAAVFYKNARGLKHFQRRHDANFGAADADLPRHQRAKDALEVLSLDYLDVVIAWFAGRVYLTPSQAGLLRSRVRGD